MDQDVGGLKKWWIRTDYESGRGEDWMDQDVEGLKSGGSGCRGFKKWWIRTDYESGSGGSGRIMRVEEVDQEGL